MRSEYPGEHAKRHAGAFNGKSTILLDDLHNNANCLLLDGAIPSTFIHTKHVSSSGVDTSSVIRVKKASTTCDKDTGIVDIGWPENNEIEKAVIDKLSFAKGATKYVYKVWNI